LQKGEYTYQLPNSFCRLKLLAPARDEVLNSTSVTFRWEGKTTGSYSLYYSTDPTFDHYDRVDTIHHMNYQAAGTAGAGIGLLFLVTGTFSLGIFSRKRKYILLFAILLSTVLLFSSCKKIADEETPPLPPEHSVTVDNLQPGTTYYWKITAAAGGELTSESITRTFNTSPPGANF
ncbi:MAG: hypothetical protein GY950_19580, partial [bacterium]|nr:hypothetical protein [bacterium]